MILRCPKCGKVGTLVGHTRHVEASVILDKFGLPDYANHSCPIILDSVIYHTYACSCGYRGRLRDFRCKD